MLRPSRVALFAAVAGLALASAASAAITHTSGHAQKTAPPASVEFGALQSATKMFAFNERQCVRLTEPLRVDITQPGTVDAAGDLSPGVIPAGTLVSSQFVHVDAPGTKTRISLSGSVTTNTRILGIIVGLQTLNASDFLGAPGTDYPTGKFGRQLEFHSGDTVTLSANRRHVTITVNNRWHADQVRIITACPHPAHRPPQPPPVHPPPVHKAEGCTPGFWKQSHHFDSWTHFAPHQRFEVVFGVDAFAGNPTLLEVLQMGGGGVNALGRQAVAALLNAASADVDFSLTTAQVISLTRDAIASGNAARIEALKDRLEKLNQGGCPLN